MIELATELGYGALTTGRRDVEVRVVDLLGQERDGQPFRDLASCGRVLFAGLGVIRLFLGGLLVRGRVVLCGRIVTGRSAASRRDQDQRRRRGDRDPPGPSSVVTSHY